MNKKIISLITAATIVASTGAVMADSPTVNVVVDGAKINFADQAAIIESDRTLIPARGVFEAMKAKVEWDDKTRTVTVTNRRNTRIAVLTIDSDKMHVTTYKSLFDVEQEDVTLDVPAQIMNDRTMIPLRAVSEAMGATVEWDGETYTASITTTDGEKAEAEKDKLITGDSTTDKDDKDDTDVTDTDDADDTDTDVADTTEDVKLSIAAISLSEAEAVNEDEVVVSIDLKGMELYPEYSVAGVKVALEYDKTVLELTDAVLANGDAVIESATGAKNADYTDTSLKVSYVTIDKESAAKADGSVMKLTFKVLKDEATDVAISAAYSSKLGYDSVITLVNEELKYQKLEGTKLIIDETPLTVND